jgi:hypothetical protein
LQCGSRPPFAITDTDPNDLDSVLRLERVLRHTRALYEGLLALPTTEIGHRRAVWSEILECQLQIDALLPPAPEPE